MDINKDVAIYNVLQYLRRKTDISELENDILSTAYKYNEQPFDRNGAELKVTENNAKHEDIYVAIKLTPGTYTKKIEQCSDEEIKNSLYMQLEGLCLKELMLLGNDIS